MGFLSRAWKDAVGRVPGRALLATAWRGALGKLLPSLVHGHSGPQSMFFALEDLPPLGKEYWFLYLSDVRRRRQFILTFGRGRGRVKINRFSLDQAPGRALQAPCASVYWSSDASGKRSGGFKGVLTVTPRPGRLALPDGGMEFDSNGKSYRLSVARGRTCDLRFKPRPAGVPFEMGRFSAGGLGFELVNLFLRFNGTLSGKPFSGEGYVQKVVAAGPFVPWNWVRVNYLDGSTLDFFSLRVVSGSRWGQLMPSRAVFFDATTGRTRVLRQCRLETAKPREWELLDREGNLLVRLVGYDRHRFNFTATGQFRYEQHFVDAFDDETDGARLAGRALGAGLGLVEDASGFML